MDGCAKIAHILDLKLPPDGSQSDPLPSRGEGSVDRIKGDAGVLAVKLSGGASEYVVGVIEQTARYKWMENMSGFFSSGLSP